MSHGQAEFHLRYLVIVLRGCTILWQFSLFIVVKFFFEIPNSFTSVHLDNHFDMQHSAFKTDIYEINQLHSIIPIYFQQIVSIGST
jgi:hypothetical protein